MTGSSPDYVAFVKEQLAPLHGITSARFFGGVGLSADGSLFAMLMDNALYFAVDDGTRPHYENMGSRCFSYATRKGRVEVKKYYEVPGEILEDQERLVGLARTSIAIARKAKKR